MPTFEEISRNHVGTRYVDMIENGIRCIILRGPASLCAYMGLPKNHPLSNRNYDMIPVNVHGGLTYGSMGDDKHLPSGYYWYGWDYAHLGDYTFYDLQYGDRDETNIKWTPDKVQAELWSATYEMKKLMELVEQVTVTANKECMP